MTAPAPSFFARVPQAFSAFFKLLFDPNFAAELQRTSRPALPSSVTSSEAPAQAPSQAVSAATPPSAEALELLALLQREGRLVDFLMQPIDEFADAEVGAAARHVHAGCRSALLSCGEVQPLVSQAEGDSVTLQDAFDRNEVKLTGNVASHGPYTGTLIHRGWRMRKLALPRSVAGADASILAQAELEL